MKKGEGVDGPAEINTGDRPEVVTRAGDSRLVANGEGGTHLATAVTQGRGWVRTKL